MPRSEYGASPDADMRCCDASISDDVTGPAGMVGAMAQPTTERVRV